MNIITITSDWSKSDYYLSALKGNILSYDCDAKIVDLNNDIPPLDVVQSMFVLVGSYAHFPKGTIHLMGVCSEPWDGNPMVIVKGDGHYFVGVNDGRFAYLFDPDSPSSIREMPPCAYALRMPEQFSTFMAAELFARAVRIIKENTFIKETDRCDIKKEVILKPMCNESSIIGKVIYIDSFGNAITNITKDLFSKMLNGRDYEILVQGPYAVIPRISRDYSSVNVGGMVALFNSVGYLEVAINQGNIAQTESLVASSEITVRFIKEKYIELSQE